MSRKTEAWIMLPVGMLLMVGAMFAWNFIELLPNNPLLGEILWSLGFIGGGILIMSGAIRVDELSRKKKRGRFRGPRSL